MDKTQKFFQLGPACDAYKITRDHPSGEADKLFLEECWGKFQPYADKNFLEKVKYEEYFIQCIWEMYLASALMEQGFNLKKRSTAKGPDICLEFKNDVIWIEAIAVKQGVGEDRVPDFREGIQDVPSTQITLRITEAIDKKFKAYEKWKEDGTVGESQPYFIAINTSDACSSLWRGSDLPYAVKAVFPFGHQQFSRDANTGHLVDSGWSHRPQILKINNSPVKTTSFLDSKYQGISGIFYHSKNFLMRSDPLMRDFDVIYNPKAKNPVQNNTFKFSRAWWCNNKKLEQKQFGMN